MQQHRLLFRRLAAEFDALALQQSDQGAVVGLGVIGHELVTVAPLTLDDLAFQGHRLDVVALHIGEELRVVDGGRLPGAHAELAENREEDNGQRDP